MIFKIIGIVLLVLFCLFVFALVVFSRIVAVNKKQLPSKEEVVEGTNGKKALILFQPSNHGTVDEMTKVVTKEFGQAGYTVISNYPTLEKTYEMKEFDVVAFGSAVYMGTTSVPINRFLENTSMEKVDVLIYVVGGEAETAPEIDVIKSKIKGAKSISAIKVTKGQEERLASFVREKI